MFIKTIGELAYGEAVQDFDETLRELVAAITEHQKPGTFQITLKMVPEGGQVVIEYAVKATLPQKDRMKTIMYVQQDGNLGRRDPRQPELPFREVMLDERPHQVNTQTGEIINPDDQQEAI